MNEAKSAGPTLDEHLWDRRCKAIHRARLSALYHLKRERFFDSIDKIATAFTAITATTAVATIMQESTWLNNVAAVATAVLSLVPLVFGPGQKAKHHAHLAAEFRRILADCERAGQRWTEPQCDEFTARVLDLEASEPAPLAALVADCENQLAIASGHGAVARVTFLHHLLKHWVDLRPDPEPRAR